MRGTASSRSEAPLLPAVCVGAAKNVVCGDPDFTNISTSHVERANLTMRMGALDRDTLALRATPPAQQTTHGAHNLHP